ncbi:hypothetical protein SAMN05192562_103160 [Kosakonia arachidis]|uniref:Uncharacterized protein n=1 Tax=Kosakonia arachidis TaxID=551989 RepID=A0A1I7C2L7_9ENTR|nr:hypothetical protein [Kosakonia arachidis]SFT93651.1 hypothetical protein SAMN05192562_103160 [Kosakonia arachidis]
MYNNNEVISYLQANRILALKLDHVVSAVGQQVTNQVETLGKDATRLLYYTSCFTDEYNDVCQQQKTEDIRFRDAVYKVIRHGDVVYDMLRIYFEEIFKYKTSEQIEHIKQCLVAVNVHIAASSLTIAGFTLAAASSVRIGLNLSLEISALAGTWASRGIAAVGVYGVVQKAADCAHRLHIQFPAYYSALYAQGLEMLYFLIEPVFQKASAIEAQWASDNDIVGIISRMIQ